jgi:acyl-CoA dehydrogenase
MQSALPALKRLRDTTVNSAEASWAAANATIDTLAGHGFNSEYDVERKFRETRLYRVAPISNNLVLAYISQHVLGMPRSY